jgi:hypothetical protein
MIPLIIKVIAPVQNSVVKRELFFLGDLECDEVPPVGTLVFPLIVVHPRDLPVVAHIHQRWEQVMVTIAAYSACLVGVDLKFVSSHVACAAVLENADYFYLVDWFFTHN